jgi:4-coumarate--CoA ligase
VCVHSFNNVSSSVSFSKLSLTFASLKVWYTTLYLAIIGAGGCCASSNPSYKTLELSNMFALTNAKFVVVAPDLLPNMLPAIRQSCLPPSNVFIFNMKTEANFQGFESLGSFLKHSESDWVQFDDTKRAKETIAALLFTSGTTGLPKAAAMSHFSLVSMNIAIRDPQPKPYEVRSFFQSYGRQL